MDLPVTCMNYSCGNCSCDDVVTEAGHIETDLEKRGDVFLIVFACVLSLMILVGNIGNVLVINAVRVSRRLRTTGNYFIVNLALADLCITLIVDPFALVGLISGSTFFTTYPDVCHVIATIGLVSRTCSMMTIAAIAINRYTFVCQRHHYDRLYPTGKTIAMCVCLWLLCLTLDIPSYLGWSYYHFDKKFLICTFRRQESLPFNLLVVVSSMVIPLIIVFTCYLLIYLFIRKRQKKMSVLANFSVDDVRLARTLFCVFVTCLVCWIPYAAFIMIDFEDRWPTLAYVIVIHLAHMSSSINCILYGATNRNFRSGYVKVLRRSGCLPDCLESKAVLAARSRAGAATSSQVKSKQLPSQRGLGSQAIPGSKDTVSTTVTPDKTPNVHVVKQADSAHIDVKSPDDKMHKTDGEQVSHDIKNSPDRPDNGSIFYENNAEMIESNITCEDTTVLIETNTVCDGSRFAQDNYGFISDAVDENSLMERGSLDGKSIETKAQLDASESNGPSKTNSIKNTIVKTILSNSMPLNCTKPTHEKGKSLCDFQNGPATDPSTCKADVSSEHISHSLSDHTSVSGNNNENLDDGTVGKDENWPANYSAVYGHKNQPFCDYSVVGGKNGSLHGSALSDHKNQYLWDGVMCGDTSLDGGTVPVDKEQSHGSDSAISGDKPMDGPTLHCDENLMSDGAMGGYKSLDGGLVCGENNKPLDGSAIRCDNEEPPDDSAACGIKNEPLDGASIIGDKKEPSLGGSMHDDRHQQLDGASVIGDKNESLIGGLLLGDMKNSLVDSGLISISETRPLDCSTVCSDTIEPLDCDSVGGNENNPVDGDALYADINELKSNGTLDKDKNQCVDAATFCTIDDSSDGSQVCEHKKGPLNSCPTCEKKSKLVDGGDGNDDNNKPRSKGGETARDTSYLEVIENIE